MKIKIVFLSLLILCFWGCTEKKTYLRLWYDEPANASIPDNDNAWKDDSEWLKALPLGNGQLGAMVFGDVNRERVQLNEKTLWSGSHFENDNPEAPKYLGEIRNLLFEGKFREATELTNKTQVCLGAGSGEGNGANVPFGCYQTLGDLWMDFGNENPFQNYHRELSLEDAIVSVSYEQDGIRFSREYFVSVPANALIVRISADKKGAISCKISLSRPERFTTSVKNNDLMMSGVLNNGQGGDGMHFLASLKAKTKGGKQSSTSGNLVIEGADEAIIILAAATDYLPVYPDYKGNDYENIIRKTMDEAFVKSFDFLKNEHIADYQKYFNRVSFQLDDAENDTNITTDSLLQQVKTTGNSNYLTQLYFQYGRYLLIASSRENTLPANLQGIWANKIQTAWNCDYHTNINVQMNYWPAEVTNLSEMHLSLIRFILENEAPATKSARVQFGAEGWCINPIVNVWGFTSPGEHPSWGLTSGASGWICQHLWEHFAFTCDTAYLREIYPTLKNAARFYFDWLVADPVTGKLVSGPATSPENSFLAPDGSTGTISMGPSHDQLIIGELFTNVLKSAEILKDKDTVIEKIKTASQNLLKPIIGDDGRLLEWADPWQETEPGHRHMSHLYGLHPCNTYTQEHTLDFVAAAEKSLRYRLAHGGGHTGWSAAWVSNFWARLKNGNEALSAINTILTKKSAPNLFDLHPPFQIDGNFGATAGIAEMLIQSHQGYIELLPALPDAWKNGEVKGLCARGGFEVDMKWKDGKIVSYRVFSKNGCKASLKYAGRIWEEETTRK